MQCSCARGYGTAYAERLALWYNVVDYISTKTKTMFGKDTNDQSAVAPQSPQAGAANGDSFVVRTMEDDLKGDGAVAVAAKQGHHTVRANQEMASMTGASNTDADANNAPSPFLEEAGSASAAAMQAVSSQSAAPQANQHIVQAQQAQVKTSTVSPKQTLAENVQAVSPKLKGGSGGKALKILLVFFAILLILVLLFWFLLRAGFVSTQTVLTMLGMQNQMEQAIATNSPDVVTDDMPDVMIAEQEVSMEQSLGNAMFVEMEPQKRAGVPMADVAIEVKDGATKKDLATALATVAETGPHTIDLMAEGDYMTFTVFATRFLEGVYPGLLTALDQPIQLYISKEGVQNRVTIYTTTTDPAATRDALRVGESTLVQGLSPIFLFAEPNAQNVVFEDSDYKGVPIRFYNFLPDTTQSVDYASHYQHVFMGTSRSTMRGVMDQVFAAEAEDGDADMSEDMQPAPVVSAELSTMSASDPAGDQ